MTFRYPLDSVLRFRESLEKNEERALEQVNAAIIRVLRQVAELDSAAENLYTTKEAAMAKGVPAGDVQWWLLRQEAARTKKKTLLHELKRLEEKRKLQLHLYQEANRNREMLTEMRQEHYDLHEQERTRKEQKMLDDIFIFRHLKK